MIAGRTIFYKTSGYFYTDLTLRLQNAKINLKNSSLELKKCIEVIEGMKIVQFSILN